MTLEEARSIISIAEEKSINKAAQKLYMTQSSLSQCLKKIETEYGFTLFPRVSGQHEIELTEEGLEFVEFARDIVVRERLFRDRLACLNESRKRMIRIGFPPHQSSEATPFFIQWFQTHHPDYLVYVAEASSDELEGMVENGSIELAYVTIDQDTRHNVSVRKIMTLPQFVYVRRGFPSEEYRDRRESEQYPYLSIKNLARETFLVTEKGTRGRMRFDRMCTRNRISPRVVVVSNLSNRIYMADEGRGCCVLSPQRSLLPMLDPSRLFLIPEDECLPASKGLVFRKDIEHQKLEYCFEAALELTRRFSVHAEEDNL